MTYEQAVCLIEILPDLIDLSCIKLSENTALTKLADAQNPQEQEEACALYASLLAATKLSQSIVLVDIEVPSERSSDVVKAMAKQVVAYCLRNMERLPVAQGGAGAAMPERMTATTTTNTTPMTPPTTAASATAPRIDSPDSSSSQTRIPNFMSDLVDLDEGDEGQEPDDGYMIGGTGVAKALGCFLNNNSNDDDDDDHHHKDDDKNKNDNKSRPSSGEFVPSDGSATTPRPLSSPAQARVVPPAKAKELSKQLLTAARKIRMRIQPALAKLSADPCADEHHHRRLVFLDQTLQSIIKRFEDEFPDTRLPEQASQQRQQQQDPTQLALPLSDDEKDTTTAAQEGSGGDYGSDTLVPIHPLSRTNSIISQTSRAHVEEEGRVHRAGHQLRQGVLTEQYRFCDTLLGGHGQGSDDTDADPFLVRTLEAMLEDLGLGGPMAEKGAVRTFREHRRDIAERMRHMDPDHWRLFAESQEKARANAQVGTSARQEDEEV